MRDDEPRPGTRTYGFSPTAPTDLPVLILFFVNSNNRGRRFGFFSNVSDRIFFQSHTVIRSLQ
jgi:hypothetical protein